MLKFKKDSDQVIDPESPGQEKPGKNKKKKSALKIGVIAAVAGVVALSAAGDSFYQIGENEQAVMVTLGKPSSVTETGLHFKIPLIQQVKKVNTTIQGFPIGYDVPTNEEVTDESVMITADYNFINIDFFVEYRIVDPVQYVYASMQPEQILKNIAQSSIRTVVGSYNVDDVLTTGKSEIQAKIKEMVTEKLEQQNIGIQLVNISMQDSEPPTAEVIQAFKAVENAKQGKETALNNANKYRNEKLPEAEAQADEIVQDAEAKKQTRINEATAQVARFNAMYEEYRKNPAVTKQRMFFETMEEVLPDMKVIIDQGSGIEKVLPLDSFVKEDEQQETEKQTEVLPQTEAKTQNTVSPQSTGGQ